MSVRIVAIRNFAGVTFLIENENTALIVNFMADVFLLYDYKLL